MKSQRLLVTGGLGFIGSAFIRSAPSSVTIENVDVYNYAADERRLVDADSHVSTHRMDVTSHSLLELVQEMRPSTLVHFAAQTHVTRSEDDPEDFFKVNVEGTRMVLDAAEGAGVDLVIHISTDEVYGPCPGRPFKENEKEEGVGRATSAYARSKALADDLAQEYANRVPVIVARLSNCLGPWQHPEKAIPRWVTRALRGERIPVWGDGLHIRDWMEVDDACKGLWTLIEKGEPGETYNLAPAGEQKTNLEIAQLIAQMTGLSNDHVYLTAYDRPQHDRRYAMDVTKMSSLGWEATSTLTSALSTTIDWYKKNSSWWETLLHDAESLYNDGRKRSAAC